MPPESSYTGVAAFDVEGARVGIMSCRLCGAAIFVDPRDRGETGVDGEPFSPIAAHDRWHRDLVNRTDPRLFSGQ